MPVMTVWKALCKRLVLSSAVATSSKTDRLRFTHQIRKRHVDDRATLLINKPVNKLLRFWCGTVHKQRLRKRLALMFTRL
ncbi:hypothetical protein TNCV_1007641 [Trichonephila clavipes]|nr:hypothetical protein TNCV_1007641 [Trichonephila clavipes]